jgi:hypothetical protein
MSKIIALLILSLMAVSCGNKAGTSAVKLKLFQGNIVSVTPMGGGILLMGKSEDGLNSFRMGLTNSSEVISLVLAKGRWEFAVVTWAGTEGPMTGDNRCAYSGFVDLQDPEVNVSFNLMMTRCLADFAGRQFTHSDYIEATGKFFDFIPVMCMNPLLTNANCPSATNNSNFTNYKVVYNPEKKGEVQGVLNPLSSNCLAILTSPRAKIPVIDAKNDSPLGAALMFYTTVDCSGNPVVYNFKDGFKNNEQMIPNDITFISNNSYLYINPGLLHNMMPIEPAAFSVSGGYYDGSTTYYNNLNVITYALSQLPANVVSMCLTLDASCSAGQWLVPTSTGIFSPPLIDGIKALKLFFKSATGVVSTAPVTTNFTIDTIAPIVFGANIVSANVSTGVYAQWSNGTEVNFKKIKLRVCDDAECSNTPRAIFEYFSPGLTTYQFPAIAIPGLAASEVVFINIMAEDKAGNIRITSSSGAAVI